MFCYASTHNGGQTVGMCRLAAANASQYVDCVRTLEATHLNPTLSAEDFELTSMGAGGKSLESCLALP